MLGENTTEYKPYKGTESYQVEDAILFFGRKRDADQVIAKILSSRMTLLHAQSGAGKTSLINALVIPELEARGWTPVRVLPHNDPVASTRSATLAYVLPHPETEVRALQRLIDGLLEPGKVSTLGGLLDMYDQLPVRDQRKRALISPIESNPTGSRYAELGGGKVTPYLCRLLRSSIDIGSFAQHMDAISQGAAVRSEDQALISEATTTQKLLSDLSSENFLSAYQSLMTYLDPPSRGLRPFFENLLQVYGQRRSHFGLILLFDQFEELFTRFVDPGMLTQGKPFNIPDWRLRYEFIEELNTLYGGNIATAEKQSSEGLPLAEQRLPIRCLISMRSEYIAQLGLIRSFAPEIDQSVHHLDLLTTEGAEEAIQQPASLYGYGYSEDCYKNVIKDLTKEERYIEPTHLSLVCEKLWDEKGRELSQKDVDTSDVEKIPQVQLDTYKEHLKGARGILGAFFQDFLNSLEDPDSRFESLELLEPLITGSGTRNIVEYRQLVTAPFRNTERRKELLDRMVNRTILRFEIRLGSQFVEITHEFLIPSIQEALRDLVSYPLRSVLRSLDAARYRDPSGSAGVEDVLKAAEFRVLHENRHKIVWDDFATELMYCAAIYYGSDRDAVRVWSENFAQREEARDLPDALRRFENGEFGRSTLNAIEFRQLNEQRSTLTLSAKQLEIVFRSALLHAVMEGEEHVRYWTRRLLE